jgi:hypothetical protein
MCADLPFFAKFFKLERHIGKLDMFGFQAFQTRVIFPEVFFGPFIFKPRCWQCMAHRYTFGARALAKGQLPEG